MLVYEEFLCSVLQLSLICVQMCSTVALKLLLLFSVVDWVNAETHSQMYSHLTSVFYMLWWSNVQSTVEPSSLLIHVFLRLIYVPDVTHFIASIVFLTTIHCTLRVTHVSPLSCASSVSPGHAGLGHPKVYINLDKPEINFCGYCGKRFVSEQHKSLSRGAFLLCRVITPEVLFNNSG